MSRYVLSNLRRLEAESIHVLRETAAALPNAVLLYSIGKDSSVLLRLAEKAFAPSRIPFPLLHIDTGWKFRDMLTFRDRVAKEKRLDLRIWTNEEGKNLTPFDDAQTYTYVTKTVALRQALDHYGFEAAIGGARRDEESSRSKERVFSVRDAAHRWDPKAQRPELWNLFNTRLANRHSMRVFPLSNWTELDVWVYIDVERIDVVPLYFAAQRPVVERAGTLLMVDDERFRLEPGEKIATRSIRFRTLGCYPLTGAIESQAKSVPEIIDEMLASSSSERQGRLIDYQAGVSMEDKKREGYF